MTDMTVARTILQQLGGNRFIAMTGAKDLVGSDDSLRMKLPSRGPAKTANGCTHMSITLNGDDLYDVEFMKWNARKMEMGVVSRHEGIYNDMLCSMFTAETGLYTSLRG